MTRPRLHRPLLAATAALIAFTGLAEAQGRVATEISPQTIRRPDARAVIVEALTQGTVAAPSAVVAVPVPTAPVPATPSGNPVETALLFPVQFAYDSAQLGREAREVLDVIADAILSDPRLRGARFLIEGHTDAIGSWGYNRALSERRAQSVAAYLMSRGLSRDQLEVVGYSWNRLIPGLSPRDASHRRVEIGRLG